MKTEESKQIKEAFQMIEGTKFLSTFILSLQRQYKRTKALSDKQKKILFQIRAEVIASKKREDIALLNEFKKITA